MNKKRVWGFRWIKQVVLLNKLGHPKNYIFNFRLNQFEDDKTLSKKDLLDFGINESELKRPFEDSDNVQNLLFSMESNIKYNMQPVRGTTFEHTKKDTISDTPVNAKCPKCGSDVSKTEKVLRKFWFSCFRDNDDS